VFSSSRRNHRSIDVFVFPPSKFSPLVRAASPPTSACVVNFINLSSIASSLTMNADAHPDSNAAKMHSFDVVSIQNVFPSFDDDDDDDVDVDDFASFPVG
jgi:hypothetical protein